MKFLVLVLAALGLVFSAKCVSIRRHLVAEKVAVEADWSQADQALAHRADLISDLVDMVRKHAPAETKLLAAVTEAHNTLLIARRPQEKIQANTKLDEALARLMLAIEN